MMFSLKRIYLALCLGLLLSLTAQAQTNADLNITLGEQRVRFAPTRSFQEMRLEVVNSVGELIFTYLTSEAEFNWNLRAGNGETLAPGLYRYALTLKYSEEQSSTQRGHFIVEQGQNQIWLTANEGAEVSGAALNASRSGGRSVAGLGKTNESAAQRDVAGRGLVDEKGQAIVVEASDKKSAKQGKAAVLATANQLAKYAPDGVTLIDSAATETDGNVGIGTNVPNAKLSVSANTAAPPSAAGVIGYFANANNQNTFITADAYGGDNSLNLHSDFLFRRARGTMAAPMRVQTDDIVGQIQMRGYGQTGFATTSRAGIRLTAAQNWTDAAQGAYLSFLTTPNGSNTINVERMRITDTGNIGIGTTNPAANMEVVGASSTSLFLSAFGSVTELTGRRANGTAASPTALLANDVILNLAGRGHIGGSNFISSDQVALRFEASEDWSGAGRGTRMVFRTTANGSTGAAVRRMMIDHDGKIALGSTGTPDQTLSVTSGNASKPGGGSWLTFSDKRLKNIKGRFTPGLKALKQLQPLRYEYKSDNALHVKGEGELFGFSAQAVQQVLPEAVVTNDKGYLLVNNDPILLTMLNAIKEQQAMIAKLQKEVRKLKRAARR